MDIVVCGDVCWTLRRPACPLMIWFFHVSPPSLSPSLSLHSRAGETHPMSIFFLVVGMCFSDPPGNETIPTPGTHGQRVLVFLHPGGFPFPFPAKKNSS